MKNKWTYYALIMIPIVALVLANNFELIGNIWFMCLLIFYFLVYRTYTDGKRLVDKGVIEKREIWKLLIPGYRVKHFKDLYLH
ncbi:MAG: hypothetical protein RIA69_02295 [Cyclobacteriaceae bacterium]